MKKFIHVAGAFFISAPAFSFQDSLISKKLEKVEISAGYFSGNLQGVKSVILRPDMYLQLESRKNFKKYELYFDIKGYYGSVLVGDKNNNDIKKLKNKYLETDIDLHLLRIFEENKHFRFSGGIYGEIFISAQNFQPIIKKVNEKYGAGEDKIPTDKNYVFGLGLQWDGVYKKFSSTLSIIYYPYGTKVAANLAPFDPLMSFNMCNKIYLLGNFYSPKLTLFLSSEFYFQKKYDGASVFSLHDGLAGTKREFDVKLGIEFFIKQKIHIYFVSYGNNNLNRGWSRTVPHGYKDGIYTGLGYLF